MDEIHSNLAGKAMNFANLREFSVAKSDFRAVTADHFLKKSLLGEMSTKQD